MTTDRGRPGGRIPGTPADRPSDRPPARSGEVFHQSAGVVIVDGERCLVVRRSDREEWVLPKGHLERGELPAIAARREAREETGLDVEILDDLGSTRYRFGPGLRHRKRVDWFLGRRVGGEVSLEPVFAAGRYVTEADAVATLTHENDREIVRRAFARLRARGG